MTQLPYGSNYRLLMLSASLKKAERTYTRDETGKFGEEGSGGGGDKEKPKEEKKPKQTPEEKAEAKSEEANANRAEVGEALGGDFSEDSLDDLQDFAEGGEGTTEFYEKAGLVSVDKDGVKSLTPEGKKLLAAANKGDVEGAKRALETAGKRVAGREARAAEAQGKADAKAKAKAERDAKAKEKAEKKPKGGGGGGGGAKAKPEKEAPEAKDKAKAEAQAQATAEAADKAGVKPAELSAMRAMAEGGKVDEADIDGLAQNGLVENTPDGFQLTSAGRSALSALERGDARGAVAAQQSAKGKQRQTAERNKAKGKADLAGAREAREREMLKPFLRENKMLKRAGLPYGFDPYSLAKHK